VKVQNFGGKFERSEKEWIRAIVAYSHRRGILVPILLLAYSLLYSILRGSAVKKKEKIARKRAAITVLFTATKLLVLSVLPR
jgi:uncharacterized protein (UPF0303 family)